MVIVSVIGSLGLIRSDAEAAGPSPHIPFGALDKADFNSGKLRVAGWAMDPDTADPVKVHFYVDGVLVGSTNARRSRLDVAARHRNGARHGFDKRLEAPRSGTVCAWAINVGEGHNRPVACRPYGKVERPTPPSNNHRVKGTIDAVRGTKRGVRVSGWAFDLDTKRSINVHVYAGAKVVGVRADGVRDDVARVHHVGRRHGFSVAIKLRAGLRKVCVYGIDASGKGPNVSLGCRTVIVGHSAVPTAKRGAVVTPTGVVVPVIETRSNGWLIRTPCFRQKVIARGTFVPGAHVVVDAGHGGSESGSVGGNGLVEKNLNLSVALRVEQILERSGLVVQLTRTSDLRVPLRTRAEIAEALEADLFISIHHNGGAVRRQSTPGIEAYYQHNSAQAKRAGGILYEELKNSFSRYNVAWVGTSKGVTSRLRYPGSDLYGIHRYSPNIPSVITEAGYLSNYAEAVNLARPSVQQAEAQAIADGVLRWLLTSDAGSGFTAHFIDPNSTGTGGTENCIDPPLG